MLINKVVHKQSSPWFSSASEFTVWMHMTQISMPHLDPWCASETAKRASCQQIQPMNLLSVSHTSCMGLNTWCVCESARIHEPHMLTVSPFNRKDNLLEPHVSQKFTAKLLASWSSEYAKQDWIHTSICISSFLMQLFDTPPQCLTVLFKSLLLQIPCGILYHFRLVTWSKC